MSPCDPYKCTFIACDCATLHDVSRLDVWWNTTTIKLYTLVSGSFITATDGHLEAGHWRRSIVYTYVANVHTRCPSNHLPSACHVPHGVLTPKHHSHVSHRIAPACCARHEPQQPACAQQAHPPPADKPPPRHTTFNVVAMPAALAQAGHAGRPVHSGVGSMGQSAR